MALTTVYEFYVELDEMEKVFNRTFQVASDMPLHDFAITLQVLFEMDGSHMYQILEPFADNEAIVGGKERRKKEFYNLLRSGGARLYHDGEEEESWNGLQTRDVTQYVLSDLLTMTKQMLHMQYDMGDDWKLFIVLKKIHKEQNVPLGELPKVLKGSGYGIIEDCGGIYGLAELMCKQGENYKEFYEGTDFDDLEFSQFDVDKKNQDLKKLFS